MKLFDSSIPFDNFKLLLYYNKYCFVILLYLIIIKVFNEKLKIFLFIIIGFSFIFIIYIFQNTSNEKVPLHQNSLSISFNKNYLKNLKHLCNRLKNIYHSETYCIAIENNKIKALYDGNETNQLKLLHKFENTYIPSSLFLKPYIYAFNKTKNNEIKKFILEYNNTKLNIIQTAILLTENHFNKKIENIINNYYTSSTENIIIQDENNMIIFNGFFNYLKPTHYKKNDNNQTIYPETFKLSYQGNGFGCSKEEGISSFITINATFPQINTHYLEFDDNFSKKVMIDFPMNVSYYINYGVATFNNKLLSLDVYYNTMGCSNNNTYGYFKTFNIDLENFKYLKLKDFFNESYIKNNILPRLYKVLKTKYDTDLNPKEIYQDFMNQFTINKNHLYFYFDQISVTSDAYGNFVIKMPYNRKN